MVFHGGVRGAGGHLTGASRPQSPGTGQPPPPPPRGQRLEVPCEKGSKPPLLQTWGVVGSVEQRNCSHGAGLPRSCLVTPSQGQAWADSRQPGQLPTTAGRRQAGPFVTALGPGAQRPSPVCHVQPTAELPSWTIWRPPRTGEGHTMCQRGVRVRGGAAVTVAEGQLPSEETLPLHLLLPWVSPPNPGADLGAPQCSGWFPALRSVRPAGRACHPEGGRQ